MTRLLVTVLLLAVFCLALAVAYYNSGSVRFDYLTGAFEAPLVAVVMGAFLLGMLVAGLLNLASAWGLKREARSLSRRLAAAEAELRTLRQLPLETAGAPATGKTPRA